MINDFNEIKDEKDRELYVQLRNILDNFVVTQIKLHDDEDHLFHECALFDTYKELQKAFSKHLRKECKINQLSEIENIIYWINHNEADMIKHMCSLIILNEEYDKRKQ